MRSIFSGNSYRYVFLSILCASIFAASTVAASGSKEVSKEVGEAGSAIKEYSISQKDKAVEEAKRLMEEFDAEMHVWEGKMEEKWADLKDSSKESYEGFKQDLKAKRNDASIWLEKMQDSSSDAWDDVKNGFSDAYDSLSESWQNAEKETEGNM